MRRFTESVQWCFIVTPASDEQVSEFFRRIAVTPTMRWQVHCRTAESGHLYQSRFKSFSVQDDEETETKDGLKLPVNFVCRHQTQLATMSAADQALESVVTNLCRGVLNLTSWRMQIEHARCCIDHRAP
jgi:hypothetical protein